MRSRALYERHGFEVTGEFNLPSGGPPLWQMWREPGCHHSSVACVPARPASVFS